MNEDVDRKMLHGCLEMLVLACLAKEERHGYGMRKDMSDRSRSYFCPAFGRLYPLLAALEQRGLVRSRRQKAGKSRVIRVYSLTLAGRRELSWRLDKWRMFSRRMEDLLADCPRPA